MASGVLLAYRNMILKNIKFTYKDAKYDMEIVDFIPIIQVTTAEYDNVLNSVKTKHPEYRDIRIISFTE